MGTIPYISVYTISVEHIRNLSSRKGFYISISAYFHYSIIQLVLHSRQDLNVNSLNSCRWRDVMEGCGERWNSLLNLSISWWNVRRSPRLHFLLPSAGRDTPNQVLEGDEGA